jgi:hypothetical protein
MKASHKNQIANKTPQAQPLDHAGSWQRVEAHSHQDIENMVSGLLLIRANLATMSNARLPPIARTSCNQSLTLLTSKGIMLAKLVSELIRNCPQVTMVISKF